MLDSKRKKTEHIAAGMKYMELWMVGYLKLTVFQYYISTR